MIVPPRTSPERSRWLGAKLVTSSPGLAESVNKSNGFFVRVAFHGA